MTPSPARFLVLCAAALALPACGGGEGRSDEDPPPSAGVPANGGLTVSEALRSGIHDVLVVRGYLVLAPGDNRLCEALAESHPPQCGVASVSVRGLDPSAFQLERAGAVRWTDEEVRLTGRLAGETLTVETTALGAAPVLCGLDAQQPPCGPGAVENVAYPYRLYTHCGIEYALFDGKTWVADPPLGDGSGNPPAGWGNPWQDGSIIKFGPRRAEFWEGPEVVRFRPAPPSYERPGCA